MSWHFQAASRGVDYAPCQLRVSLITRFKFIIMLSAIIVLVISRPIGHMFLVVAGSAILKNKHRKNKG